MYGVKGWDKGEHRVGWRWKRKLGMRTARRLRRQNVKNDKDADAVEVNFLSTLGESPMTEYIWRLGTKSRGHIGGLHG